MGSTVADLAEKILSEDILLLGNATAEIGGLKFQNALAEGDPVFPRLVQELAAYKQGLVIKTLLKRTLAPRRLLKFKPAQLPEDFFFTNFENEEETLAHMSFMLLNTLAASKSVVEVSLREKGASGKLMRYFMERIPSNQTPKGPSGNWQIIGPTPVLLPSIQGLLSFARASEQFRDRIRDDANLLPSLQILFSKEFVQQTPADAFEDIAMEVLSFLFALIEPKDSQEWAIENGYLELVSDILTAATHTRTLKSWVTTSACCFLILRLCESPSLAKKASEAGVFKALTPFASTINSTFPNVRVWDALQCTLKAPKNPSVVSNHPPLKALMKQAKVKRNLGISTVCSWERCTELGGFEQTVQRFSRCARCSVAYYCGKEHQMLHWPSHKRHCLPK